MKLPFLIGRALFGGFFLYSGIHHFLKSDQLARYAGAKHVPAPDLAVKASGIALMAGGASILLGLKPRYGTAAVIAFLAAASGSIHNFWASQDPGERQNEISHFAKNLALAGGALALAGVEEPWPASVSALRSDRGAKTVWRVLAA